MKIKCKYKLIPLFLAKLSASFLALSMIWPATSHPSDRELHRKKSLLMFNRKERGVGCCLTGSVFLATVRTWNPKFQEARFVIHSLKLLSDGHSNRIWTKVPPWFKSVRRVSHILYKTHCFGFRQLWYMKFRALVVFLIIFVLLTNV